MKKKNFFRFFFFPFSLSFFLFLHNVPFFESRAKVFLFKLILLSLSLSPHLCMSDLDLQPQLGGFGTSPSVLRRRERRLEKSGGRGRREEFLLILLCRRCDPLRPRSSFFLRSLFRPLPFVFFSFPSRGQRGHAVFSVPVE